MDDSQKRQIGSIGWIDLTVEGAEEAQDFYRQVVGWETTGVDMGGYEDYCMNLPATGETVAGVCHARGANAGLPPQWLVYVVVADLDASLARCTELGGEVVAGPKAMGEDRYAVIRDPAGAVSALYEAAA